MCHRDTDGNHVTSILQFWFKKTHVEENKWFLARKLCIIRKRFKGHRCESDMPLINDQCHFKFGLQQMFYRNWKLLSNSNFYNPIYNCDSWWYFSRTPTAGCKDKRTKILEFYASNQFFDQVPVFLPFSLNPCNC